MKPFRERNPILVGLISVGVLTVLMTFAFSLNRFTFFRGVYSVEADFADAAGLTVENEVRVAGLKVGKVKSIELAGESGDVRDRVHVVMEIASSIKLGDASEAEIKLKTILGQKFVDIVPKGGAPYVRGSGAIIPLERTRIPFELYQVTNRSVATIGEIDADALNDALRELGTLFDDPEGNLGRALDGLSKASVGLKDSEAELEQLVTSGGEILEVLGSRSEALGRIFDEGAELLAALHARRDSLARFVDGSDKLARELSDLLKDTRVDLDPALRDLHTTLLVVKKNIVPLEQAVAALGPSAKSFARATQQGRWVDIWLQTIEGLPIPPVLP